MSELETFLVRTGVPLSVIVFAFGAIVGSFLNVVIARLPYGESVVSPRSKCPTCETPIPSWHNIPILSYLLLRGKCGTCKSTIDARYPAVELLTAVLFVACLSRFGLSVAFLGSLAVVAALVSITFIDIDLFEIPDQIVIPGIVLTIVLRPLAFDVPFYSGVVGALAGGGAFLAIRYVYFVWRGAEGMGLGDVKLLAMIGGFIGAIGLIPAVLVASFAGSIAGAALKIFGPKVDDQEDQAEAEPPEDDPNPPPDGFFARTVWAFRATFLMDDEPQEEEEEDDWEPPPGAIPFGPFLAIGAIAQLLFGPTFQRILMSLGI